MTDRKYGSNWRIITEEDLKRIIEEEQHQEEIILAEKKKFTATYWKRNSFPLLMELLFVISCFFVPSKYFVYTNFIVYLIIFIYFLILEHFSFSDLWENMRSGRFFWRKVILTSTIFAITLVGTDIVSFLFPDIFKGIIRIQISNSFDLVLFLMSSMFFTPIVEETLFRQNIINPENKKLLFITFIFNLFLSGIMHAISPYGFFLSIIWALPLTIAYIKTQNLYIVITAHMIINILVNLAYIIFVTIIK